MFKSTDLYSLGCTLLFLLTGDSPAELPQRKLKINFRSQVKLKRDFANWIEKLIEPDAPHRFNNSQDALAVLKGQNSLTNYNKTKELRFERQRGEWRSDMVESIPTTQALSIEYKRLGGWKWDGLKISYEETDRAIYLPTGFFSWTWIFNHQIGALLSSPEKKWLQEELVKKLKIN